MNLPYESLMWLRLLHERPGTNLQPYEVSHRDAVLDYLAHLETFRDGWVRFQMDRAGIERREAEAEELVELRAKVMLLQGKYDRLRDRLTEIGKAEYDRWKEGVASERRKVVAFLREPAPEEFSAGEYADWIERGDHAESKDESS